jgi:hypothetical protein
MWGLLALSLSALAIAAPTASAAPSPVRFSVSSNAQYLSPTSIIVPVSVTCPVGLTAFVSVSVQEQNLTNATGSGFISNLTCTGSSQTLAVTVTGTDFTPGKAYANGFASSGLFFDQDIRQIQIVV